MRDNTPQELERSTRNDRLRATSILAYNVGPFPRKEDEKMGMKDD
jgi:hypothetical protein